MRRGRGLVRAVTLLAIGVVTAVVLARSGQGSLAPPESLDPSELRSWATERSPVAAALAIVRLVALALATQVGLTVLCTALGVILHVPALVRIADLVALPGARTLARKASALAMSTLSLVRAGDGSADIPRSPPTVTMVRLDSGSSAAMARLDAEATATRARTDVRESATMARIDGEATATMTQTDVRSVATMRVLDTGGTASMRRDPLPDPPRPKMSSSEEAGAASAGASHAGGGRLDAGVHVVERGEHLWSIATARLRAGWGRAPTEVEVTRYWRRVVGANPQLADADLVHVGQRITLPPLPPDRSRGSPGQGSTQSSHA